MVEEYQSDQGRFFGGESAVVVEDSTEDEEEDEPEPSVVELGEDEEEKQNTINRDWVHDPTEEAPNRWTNTETGEYRYQETKPEPIDGDDEDDGEGGNVEITDYEVESEFGYKVASIMQTGGDPVGEIYAKAWQSFAGRIDDEDLLIDALREIADHGTQTAEDRIRQRLRGMEWESEEIDRAIQQDDDEIDTDEIAEGDEFVFDFAGAPTTEVEIISVNEDGSYQVEYEDGAVQYPTDEDFNYAEEITEETRAEDFDLETTMDRFEFTGTPRYGDNDPGEIDRIQTIAENATTEELEEYAQTAGEIGDPLEALQEWYESNDGEEPAQPHPAEAEAHQLMSQYEDGEVSEEEVRERAEEMAEYYPDSLDLKDEEGARLAKGLLWYRDDTDMDVSISELANFDLANQGVRATDAKERTVDGISEAMSEMNPAVGAWAITSTTEISVEKISDNAAGRRKSGGRIVIDYNGNNIERTAAHELGHQVHYLMGLETENYPSNFNFGADRDEYGFGTPEGTAPPEGEEFADDMRKRTQKNWERYQNHEVNEIRSYQKKHGVEYAAVTFAHWSYDKSKLQGRDPFAKQMWDVHAGDGEYAEIDGVADLQQGDQVVVDAGMGNIPTLVEIESVQPGTNEIMAFPMNVHGKSDGTVPYGAEEMMEGTVVRFDD